MFKNILNFLDKTEHDSIYERIDREPIFGKYAFLLSSTIIMSLLTIIFAFYMLILKSHVPPVETNIVNLKEKTVQTIPTVPFPHQSFKNVSSWFIDAVSASYSFDFNNIDDRIEKAEYYYSPEGYKMYLAAIESSGIKDSVIAKKIQVSILPLQSAVPISSGQVLDTEFWRYRVPVLVNYYAGKDSKDIKMLVEALIVRVPAYKNEKGLAITEFIMTPL